MSRPKAPLHLGFANSSPFSFHQFPPDGAEAPSPPSPSRSPTSAGGGGEEGGVSVVSECVGTGATRRGLRGSHCGPSETAVPAGASPGRGRAFLPRPLVWPESGGRARSPAPGSSLAPLRGTQGRPSSTLGAPKSQGPGAPVWGSSQAPAELGGRNGRKGPSARGRSCTDLHRLGLPPGLQNPNPTAR